MSFAACCAVVGVHRRTSGSAETYTFATAAGLRAMGVPVTLLHGKAVRVPVMRSVPRTRLGGCFRAMCYQHAAASYGRISCHAHPPPTTWR